jgi:membrane protease YdiL (CAAX protease family)
MSTGFAIAPILPLSAGASAHAVAPTRGRFAIFVAASFAISWACWLLAPVIKPESATAAAVLSALGGFGPGIAAVVVIGQIGGGGALRGWLTRCLQWRIGWRVFAWACLLPLAVLVPAALLHVALGGAPGSSPVTGHLPMAAANVVLILLLGGPLGEEFGWRGYALPALQVRHGWRASSLLLGVVWGLWHLPLFFIEGSLHSGLPMLPFMASAIALSVVFGWLSLRSRGSVLPALVLHTAVNWWAWVVPGLLAAGHQRQIVIALLMLGMLAIGLMFWPTHPSDRPTQ